MTKKNATTVVKVDKIKSNPNNPRLIKDEKFEKLVKSIQEFPEMLELRPVIVNKDMVVLGGNMRLKAAIECGLKEVPVIIAEDLTDEKQKEFIIKDNVGYGDWDWDTLATDEWDYSQLKEWGLDVVGFGMDSDFNDTTEYNYQNKVTIQFKDFETATVYYENCIKENLKATLS